MKKLLTLLLLTPLSAFADSVYQCTVDGVSTFSQTPCDDEYKKIDVFHSSGAGTTQAEVSETQEKCLHYLSTKFSFEKPEAIKIENAKNIWLNDKSGARHVLVLDVNTKDEEGQYKGSKSYQCFLNYEGTQLSKTQALIN